MKQCWRENLKLSRNSSGAFLSAVSCPTRISRRSMICVVSIIDRRGISFTSSPLAKLLDDDKNQSQTMTILRHETIGKVFSSLGIHPVLMHVGARRHSPPIWAPVAPYSVYVGVGPEARTVNASSGKGFWQVHLIECALTDTEGQNTVPANVCFRSDLLRCSRSHSPAMRSSILTSTVE